MIIDAKSLKNDDLIIDDFYYCMIIAISKRAREIVDEGIEGCDNPLAKAVDEFKSGKIVIDLPDEIV